MAEGPLSSDDELDSMRLLSVDVPEGVAEDPRPIVISSDGQCISSPERAGAGDIGIRSPGADASVEDTKVKVGCEPFCGPEFYRMMAGTRGYCVLINNVFDEEPRTNRYRQGSELDESALKEVFRQLGFVVVTHKNLKAFEVSQVFHDYSKKHQLLKHDAFVGIVLTHGRNSNTIVGTDEMDVSIEDLLELYNNTNCRALMGKPKMFFFQSCRGVKHDFGVEHPHATDAAGVGPSGTVPQRVANVRWPTWSDMLIGYSTIDGNASYRNVETGSWFIDALVRTLAANACDTEIYRLMQMVSVT